MIAPMCLLLVFAQAIGSRHQLAAGALIWGMILLFIATATLTVSSVFFSRPVPYPELVARLSGVAASPPRNESQSGGLAASRETNAALSVPAPAPPPPPRPEPSSPGGPVTDRGLTVRVERCDRSAGRIVCRASITNNDSTRVGQLLVRKTTLELSAGQTFDASEVVLAGTRHHGHVNAELQSGRPTGAEVWFDNAPAGLVTISAVSFSLWTQSTNYFVIRVPVSLQPGDLGPAPNAVLQMRGFAIHVDACLRVVGRVKCDLRLRNDDVSRSAQLLTGNTTVTLRTGQTFKATEVVLNGARHYHYVQSEVASGREARGEVWFDAVPASAATVTEVTLSMWAPNTNYFVAPLPTELPLEEERQQASGPVAQRGFKLEFDACSRAGSRVMCALMITNEESARPTQLLTSSSKLRLESGAQFVASEAVLAGDRSNRYVSVTLPSGKPRRAELWFDNVPAGSATVAAVDVGMWSPNTNYFTTPCTPRVDRARL